MDVSENSGTPKSSILIGFSIIFTIHFGVPLFLETPICVVALPPTCRKIPIGIPGSIHGPDRGRERDGRWEGQQGLRMMEVSREVLVNTPSLKALGSPRVSDQMRMRFFPDTSWAKFVLRNQPWFLESSPKIPKTFDGRNYSNLAKYLWCLLSFTFLQVFF